MLNIGRYVGRVAAESPTTLHWLAGWLTGPLKIPQSRVGYQTEENGASVASKIVLAAQSLSPLDRVRLAHMIGLE